MRPVSTAQGIETIMFALAKDLHPSALGEQQDANLVRNRLMQSLGQRVLASGALPLRSGLELPAHVGASQPQL